MTKQCAWKKANHLSGCYLTGCGKEWHLGDTSPATAKLKNCPCCGGKIIVENIKPKSIFEKNRSF